MARASRVARPRRSVLLAGLVLAAVLTAGVASGVAVEEERPPQLGAAPPREPIGYCDPRPEPVPWEIKAKQKYVCGSIGNDRIVATGGNRIVEAFQGDDLVRTRNAKPDEIYGGPGRGDRAIVDGPCLDRLIGIEEAQLPKKYKRCTGRRTLQAGPVYLRTPPRLACEVTAAGPRVRLLTLPSMRAADVTPAVDWQTVAWSALLYRREGVRWMLVAQTPWYSDRTTDRPLPNRWRDTRTRLRAAAVELLAPGVGTFRVGIRYHWYAQASTGAHTEFDWPRHGGPYAAPAGAGCEFTE